MDGVDAMTLYQVTNKILRYLDFIDRSNERCRWHDPLPSH